MRYRLAVIFAICTGLIKAQDYSYLSLPDSTAKKHHWKSYSIRGWKSGKGVKTHYHVVDFYNREGYLSYSESFEEGDVETREYFVYKNGRLDSVYFYGTSIRGDTKRGIGWSEIYCYHYIGDTTYAFQRPSEIEESDSWQKVWMRIAKKEQPDGRLREVKSNLRNGEPYSIDESYDDPVNGFGESYHSYYDSGRWITDIFCYTRSDSGDISTFTMQDNVWGEIQTITSYRKKGILVKRVDHNGVTQYVHQGNRTYVYENGKMVEFSRSSISYYF